MKLIYKEDIHTVFKLGFLKLKFNTGWKTNKIYLKKSNGELKELRKPPKGVKIYFRRTNSKFIFEEGCLFINCTFEIYENSQVYVGKTNKYKLVNMYALLCDNSKLKIGNNVNCVQVNIGCGSNSEIIIGNDCMISKSISIQSSDWHPIYDIKSKQCINNPKNIVIGNNVWLCENVKILKGACIPDNCIIGNSALVTGKLETTNSIYAGIPAKKIKEGIYWEREFVS